MSRPMRCKAKTQKGYEEKFMCVIIWLKAFQRNERYSAYMQSTIINSYVYIVASRQISKPPFG